MDSSACELEDDEEFAALIYQSSETAKALKLKAGIALAPSNAEGNGKASDSLELECDQSVAQEKNKVNSNDGQQKQMQPPPAPSRDGQQTLRPSSCKRRSTVEAREVGNVNNTAEARSLSVVTPTQQKRMRISHGAQTKKYVKRTCSAEGCTNWTQKGGVCIRHGALYKRAKCSFEGCTNQSRQKGVCIRHGAHTKKRVRRTCSAEGCTAPVQKEGMCFKHRALQRICSAEGNKSSAQVLDV